MSKINNIQGLNNFHGYFPGGMYREDKWDSIKINFPYPEIYAKKSKDVDKIIEETGFDVEDLKKHRDAICDVFDKICKGPKLEENVEKMYIKTGRFHHEKMEKMITPIYKKMLELGYTRKDLIS